MKNISIVLGSNIPEMLHITKSKQANIQRFAKDEVLLKPALDPYLDSMKAAKSISEGRSLVLDAMLRT